MSGEAEFRGHWWLPNEFESIVGGSATQSNSGELKLQVYDSFSESTFPVNTEDKYNKIIGATTEGEYVTLNNCLRMNQSHRTKGTSVNPATYGTQVAFKGARFEKTNIAFDSMKISFPELEEWVRLQKVTGEDEIENPPYINSGDILNINFEFPESVEVDFGEIKVSLSITASKNINNWKGGSIDTTAYIKIEPRRPRVPFPEYEDWIRQIQNFISFGLSEPTKPGKITGKIDGKSIEIIGGISNGDDPTNVHPNKVNFNYGDIEGQFDEVLGNWFKKQENLSPVFDLYFGALHSSDMYIQNEFLNMCQAIETYHRRTHFGKYLNEEKYEDFYDDLCCYLQSTLEGDYDLPDSFIDHLVDGTFYYANEYSLRKQLKEVTTENERIIEDLPWNLLNKEDRIANIRNYLTHYDESMNIDYDDAEILELLFGLKQLVECCLLGELGIEEEHTKRRLKKRYEEKEVV